MTKKLSFALALMAALFFGGLVYETASAGQNNNSNMTMGPSRSMNRRHHRRHHRRWWRRHRRGRMGRRGGNSNT